MKTFNRLFLYLLGLFIITIGVNLSIISGLGISPVSAFNLPISLATGVNLGMVTTISYTVFVVIQIFLLKKDFKKKNLLQSVFSFAFGYFINLTGDLLSFITPTTYLQQFAVMIIGIVVCAFGAAIYIVMDIVPNAPEGLNLAFAQRFKMPFSKSKIIFDLLFVGIGVIISLMFLSGNMVIREGTIISAILTGKMIGVFLKYMQPTLKRIAFDENNQGIDDETALA